MDSAVRESAAIHEAGHIFMAGFLGIRIKEAIFREVKFADHFMRTPSEYAIIFAAGEVAQEFMKVKTWRFASYDDRLAVRVIFDYANQERLPHRKHKKLWREACEHVKHVFAINPQAARRIIREIANRILTKGKIYQSDLEDLQKGAA